MIKVCSLDFVNKETFETDIMTAEGGLLCSATDKVTPDKILKLYFKEIYIKESEVEPKPRPIVESVEIITKDIGKLASQVASKDVDNLSSALGVKATDSEESTVDKALGPKFAETDENISIDKTKGPKPVDSNTLDTIEKGPKFADSTAIEDVPKLELKGPEYVYSDKYNEETPETKTHAPTISDKIEPIEEEVLEENQPLKFDIEQAKRMVEYSLKLGEILNFNAKELKELEQVAYYYNIGVSEFKKSDVSNKDFRKMKALASYELLIESGEVPSNIAEIIKFSATAYESTDFPLDTKIPYHHIVAITGYYEDLLALNNSKELTLMKMLQMGGNHFNIFVLHKFIKLMRDNNE